MLMCCSGGVWVARETSWVSRVSDDDKETVEAEAEAAMPEMVATAVAEVRRTTGGESRVEVYWM